MTSPLRFLARRAAHRELPWPAATGYRMFRDKEDGTVRAVFRPSV
jgi:hypothetical protein